MDINELFALANGGGQAVGSVGKGLGSLLDLVQKDKAVDNDTVRLIMELQIRASDLETANDKLRSALNEALGEYEKLEKRTKDFERYKLSEPYPGMFVYASPPTDEKNEPAHYLCPACYDRNVKSILQGGGIHKDCATCKTAYRFEDLPQFEARKTPSGW